MCCRMAHAGQAHKTAPVGRAVVLDSMDLLIGSCGMAAVEAMSDIGVLLCPDQSLQTIGQDNSGLTL
jgi:hypothetical protein